MENKNLKEGNDYSGPTLSFGQECVLNLGECKVHCIIFYIIFVCEADL